MSKYVLASSVGVAALAFVAIVILMIVMMVRVMSGGMMGGSMGGMMGGGSDPADEAAVEGVSRVRLQGFSFVPVYIIGDAGSTVTWLYR